MTERGPWPLGAGAERPCRRRRGMPHPWPSCLGWVSPTTPGAPASKPSAPSGTSLTSTFWFTGTVLFVVGALVVVGLWDNHTSGASAATPAHEPKNTVDVVETDFHIAMSQTVLPANSRITFVV